MPVGSKDEPEHRIMRLSEAFEGKSHSLELLADSYNINLAKGKSFWILVMNCGVIVVFVAKVQEYLAAKQNLTQAIKK